MSPAGPLPTNPSPADRAASSRALTDRQLAKLERLAEIGMEIAEAAGRAARSQADGAGAQGVDPGLSYARAARAVRLTIALQARLSEGLVAAEQGRAKARAADAARLRDRIHRRVERACEAEASDADEVETLSSAAWERLTETEDDEILDLPFDEAVAWICRELGLAAGWGGQEEAPSVGCADSSPAPQGSRTDASSPPLQRGGGGRRRRTEGASVAQDTEPPPAPPRPHIGPALAPGAL